MTLDTNTINALVCSSSPGNPDELHDNLEDTVVAVDNYKAEQRLANRLDSVLRHRANGNKQLACAELGEFVEQIDRLLEKGWLTAVEAARLRGGAAALSLAMGC